MKRIVPLFIYFVIGAAACSQKGTSDAPAQNHNEHSPEESAHAHGHADDDEEVSDLDRPVAELFADVCEHDIPTYTCDECRYEVGVVKVPERLFDAGLVRTAKAERRFVGEPLDLTGEVEFDERRIAHVSSLVDGIIQKVHVSLGDTVRRGQALLELASIAAGDAEAEYLEADGLLRLAKQSMARVSALKEEAVASDKEALAAAQALEAAQIRRDAALGRMKRLGMRPGAKPDKAAGSGRLILRAPVDGTVLDMHAVKGEVAHPESPVVTIGDNSVMWVWADLYENQIARASATTDAAKPAEVRVKAFPDRVFDGTLDFVSPAMNKRSRTVKARISVPNPDGLLPAGMFADVRLGAGGGREAITVPSAAVSTDEGRSFVFVRQKEDYYVRRPVTAGVTFNGITEITEGLKEGETVAADGSFLLKSDVLRSKMGAGCAD